MDQENRVTSTDFRDNNVEWINGGDRATASFYGKKYINRIKRLAEKYPEEVDYKENEDGSIICHFPVRYVKISRPVQRELTEEQRQQAAERFARYREEQRNDG